MKKLRNIVAPVLLICLVGCNTNKNTVYFKVSKRDIELGEEITLSWDIPGKRVKSVSIENVADDLPLKGEMKVRPSTTESYRLIIEREKDNPIRKRYTVSVREPEIELFEGSEFITDEQNAQLKWSVSNAEHVSIEGFRDNLRQNDQITFDLDSTRDFKLIAENNFGQRKEKSFLINVKVIEEFSAPDEIYYGDTAYISWKFKNAKTVTVERMTGTYEPQGSLRLLPRKPVRYVFNITSPTGQVRKKTHKINVLPPSIIYFSAPRTVNKGNDAHLSWSVKGDAKVSIQGVKSDLPKRGQMNINPEKSGNYKLIIENEKLGLREAKSIFIKVIERRSFVSRVNNLGAGSRIDFDILSTDISRYPDVVKIKVIAVDANGNFINGMAPPYGSGQTVKKHFKSLVETINGKTYSISNFSVNEVHLNSKIPCNIALAVDYTASLDGTPMQQLNEAIELFINKKQSADKISLVQFSDTIITVVQPTVDKQEFISQAGLTGATHLGGSTSLYAGADLCLSTITGADNKSLIVFTDGNDNASFKYHTDRAVTPEQLVKNARETGVPVHFVAFGNEVNNDVLRKTAWYTGGNLYEINRPNEIVQVFGELPFVLRNYYEITYKPVKLEGLHSVKLVYNNLINSKTSVNSEFFIGENYTLDQSDIFKETYWIKYANSIENLKKFKPVAPPQAVVFFGFDRSDLQEQFIPNLAGFIDYMNANKNAMLIIFGHTDQKGSNSYCMELSRQRGEQIRKYLVQQKIEANRIINKPCGKNYPIWQSEEFEWQSKENRRIEILILN